MLSAAALFISLSCCIEIKSCQPIRVDITEIGTCQGYDEETWTPVGITDTFSVDDKRIYLYFYLETNVELSLRYRWYHDDELVYVRQDSVHTSGYHFSWVSPKQGEPFLVGDHRVEVVLGKSVLRATEFRVKE